MSNKSTNTKKKKNKDTKLEITISNFLREPVFMKKVVNQLCNPEFEPDKSVQEYFKYKLVNSNSWMREVVVNSLMEDYSHQQKILETILKDNPNLLYTFYEQNCVKCILKPKKILEEKKKNILEEKEEEKILEEHKKPEYKFSSKLLTIKWTQINTMSSFLKKPETFNYYSLVSELIENITEHFKMERDISFYKEEEIDKIIVKLVHPILLSKSPKCRIKFGHSNMNLETFIQIYSKYTSKLGKEIMEKYTEKEDIKIREDFLDCRNNILKLLGNDD